MEPVWLFVKKSRVAGHQKRMNPGYGRSRICFCETLRVYQGDTVIWLEHFSGQLYWCRQYF